MTTAASPGVGLPTKPATDRPPGIACSFWTSSTRLISLKLTGLLSLKNKGAPPQLYKGSGTMERLSITAWKAAARVGLLTRL